MKLKITGNIVELHNKVESYKSNLRTELKNKKKRASRVCIALLSCSVFCLILAIILHIRDHIFSGNFCGLSFLILLIVLLVYGLVNDEWNQNSESIENEVISSARKIYGDRLDIIEAYQAGTIVKTKIGISPVIEFLIKDQNELVRKIIISPNLIESANTKYKNNLELSLQDLSLTMYYDDEIHNDEQLEIQNQFIPKYSS